MDGSLGASSRPGIWSTISSQESWQSPTRHNFRRKPATWQELIFANWYFIHLLFERIYGNFNSFQLHNRNYKNEAGALQ